MQTIKKFLILIFVSVSIISCETPNKPNFSVEQRTELPLLKEKKFYFLGGSDAFIDTTQLKTDTLFTVGNDNVVYISFTDSIDIGSLDDAIPSIDIDPSVIDSEVGTIEVDDFESSFGSEVGSIDLSAESLENSEAQIGTFKPEFSGTGSASFLSITGIEAPVIPAPILAGNKKIVISLNAGSFISATIVSGGIDLDFTNNLGFNISSLTARLRSNSDSNPTFVGSTADFGTVNHGEDAIQTIVFSENDVLELDLDVEVTIQWDAQNYTVNGSNSLEVSSSENEMVVSSATAELPSQALTPNTPDIEISDPGFSFAQLSSEDTSEMNKLVLTLTNNTNLPLSNATFTTFPTLTLRNSDGEELDGTKSIIPANPIGQVINPGETASVEFNLAGKRLTKVLSYTLDLGTSGSSGASVAISSTDAVILSASTTAMSVSNASAVVDAQADISLSDEAIVEGDFVRAEVSNGSLNLDFTNTLTIPLTINSLTIVNKDAFVTKNTNRFIAAGTEIGTLNNIVIPANGTASASIDLSGKALSDAIQFEATASSDGSNGQPTLISSSDLINIAVAGSISVSEAEAKLNPQTFDTKDTLEIDKENFEFVTANHFVRLKSGQLIIDDLINSLDVSVDTLTIKVNSIVDVNGNPLIIGFYGNTRVGNIFPKIQRKENGTRPPVVVDLANYQIKALNNKVVYELFGKTEDTKASNEPNRVIRSTDKVSATLTIQDLQIAEALGKISRKEVILGEDDEANGIDVLDIQNDNEAEVVDNDGFKDISDKLTNLQLLGAELSINYTTNIGVNAVAYMAIAGRDKDGNLFYLQGKNENLVTDADNITKIYDGGVRIDNANLVKFSIGANATSPTTSYNGSISFNQENSNVDEFLSKLPSEIRTIGITVINPTSEPTSYVANPIIFDTRISIDIPLALSTANGDVEVNENLGNADFFEDFGKTEDNFFVNEMNIQIHYENRIPLGVEVNFEFLDSLGTVLNVSYTPILLDAAQVDENGFTTVSGSGKAELLITNDDELNKTRKMNLILKAKTSESNAVKIRSDDFVTIRLSASTTSTNTVGN